MIYDGEDFDTVNEDVETAEDVEIRAWMRKMEAMRKKHGEALKAMIADWDYDQGELLTFVKIFSDENPRD